MGGSSGISIPEDLDLGDLTPPVGVQRRQVIAPPADYRPGIDPEWEYFGSTLNPPADPTGPITDPIFTYPGVAPTFPPGWNPYDIDLGIDYQEDGGGFDLGQFFPEYTPPEIDYDLLASKIDMPTFDMPDYSGLNQQFLDLQTGLGGLESQFQDFQMPSYEMPEIDYDLLAGNIAGNINMPSFEMPDYTQQFENLQTGLGGLGSQIGNMPSFQMPDYSQQFENLQGTLGGLGQQIGGLQMPSFDMPDYSQQFADIQAGLGGIGSQIGNIPSFQMPDYSQQFADIQTGLGGIGQQIGDMPSYQGYGGPSLEDIQGIMPSYQMPDYSSQFEGLQQQIGGLGYGGPSLEDIQGIMPSYQGYGGPSLEDIQGIMPSYGGPSLEDIQGIMPSFDMPDYSQQFADIQSGLGGLGSQIGNMPSFQMPDYNQQFQNLQDQIGGLGYGGPSLEDIQGIMPTYQMPDYSQDLSAIMGSLNALQPQQYVPENPYGTSGWGFAKGGKIPRYQEGEGIAGLTEEEDEPMGYFEFQDRQARRGYSEGSGPYYAKYGVAAPIAAWKDYQAYKRNFSSSLPEGDDYSYIDEDETDGMTVDIEGNITFHGKKGRELIRDRKEKGLTVTNILEPRTRKQLGGALRYQAGEGIAGLTRELGGTGGEEAMMTEGNEQLIQATVQAILGMLPDQQTVDAVIQKFIGLYGQEAFTSLREQVLQSQSPGAQTEGLIEGFGGGMDDFVPGIAGSQERIATSPGEYIVPADVVSQLGDGNSNEGSRKLDGMSKRVRMAKTGTIKQAKPIDSKKVLPV